MANKKLKVLDPVRDFDEPVKKQEDLPGMENRGIPEIEECAHKYAAIRDRRIGLNKQEGDTKALLLALLKKHDLRAYKHDGVEAEIVPEGETVKVRIKEASEEEANAVRDKTNPAGANRKGRKATGPGDSQPEEAQSADRQTVGETGTTSEPTEDEDTPF